MFYISFAMTVTLHENQVGNLERLNVLSINEGHTTPCPPHMFEEAHFPCASAVTASA